MKTQITISNKETCITITVEHNEPLNVSSQLEEIDKMLEKIDEKSKQSSRVIDAAGELVKEIRDFKENPVTSSENPDTSSENLDTSQVTFDIPPVTKPGPAQKKPRNSVSVVNNQKVSPLKGKQAQTTEGKNCPNCGRWYKPTSNAQVRCRKDCKPLSEDEKAALSQALLEVEAAAKAAPHF